MAFTPENSALRLSSAQEKQVAEMSPEQMKSFFASLAVERGLANRDAYDPSILHVTELAGTAPKRFAKVLRINGQQHILEEESPEALVAAETELYRSLFANQDATANADSAMSDQPRDEYGRFVSVEDAAAKTELELKFKRGDISAADYLEQSGAVSDFLATRGISLDDLRAATEQTYTRNWAEATEEFLESPAGADWPGGEENMRRIGEKMIELGLQDRPSVESLKTAYAELKREGSLTENPQTVAAQKQYNDISNATSVEQIRSLAGGSSFFGR